MAYFVFYYYISLTVYIYKKLIAGVTDMERENCLKLVTDLFMENKR